jgi:hypothetical protein
LPTTTPSCGAVATGDRVHQAVAVIAGGEAAVAGAVDRPHHIERARAAENATVFVREG